MNGSHHPAHPRALANEDGQAVVESTWLLAALVLGAAGIGWPLFEALLTAWTEHGEAIRFVVDSPFP